MKKETFEEGMEFVLSNREALELTQRLCEFLNRFEGSRAVLIPYRKSFIVTWDVEEHKKKEVLLERLSTKQLKELSLRYAQTLEFWTEAARVASKSKKELNYRDCLLFDCICLSNKKINAFLKEKKVKAKKLAKTR